MAGRCVVFVCLENTDPIRDDVAREIGDNKENVPVHEVVVRYEGLKVGTRENGHLPTGAIEVGRDRVLVA